MSHLTPGQRLLCHTLLTVIFLAALGWFLVQLAALALHQNPLPASPDTPEDQLPQQELLATLQWQLPLRLAGLGALVVLIGEGLLIVVRRSLSQTAAHRKSTCSTTGVSSSYPSPSAGSSTSSFPS
jgi:hypothetical protein